MPVQRSRLPTIGSCRFRGVDKYTPTIGSCRFRGVDKYTPTIGSCRFRGVDKYTNNRLMPVQRSRQLYQQKAHAGSDE
jgi:hypothetical protein